MSYWFFNSTRILLIFLCNKVAYYYPICFIVNCKSYIFKIVNPTLLTFTSNCENNFLWTELKKKTPVPVDTSHKSFWTSYIQDKKWCFDVSYIFTILGIYKNSAALPFGFNCRFKPSEGWKIFLCNEVCSASAVAVPVLENWSRRTRKKTVQEI